MYMVIEGKSLSYADIFSKGIPEQHKLYSWWLFKMARDCTLKCRITLRCLYAVQSKIITVNVQLLSF